MFGLCRHCHFRRTCNRQDVTAPSSFDGFKANLNYPAEQRIVRDAIGVEAMLAAAPHFLKHVSRQNDLPNQITIAIYGHGSMLPLVVMSP